MDASFCTKKIKRLISTRNLLAFAVLALSCSLFRLSSLVSSREERIVVIPGSGPSYWIERGAVSEEYLEEMGVYLSSFLLDRTPLDVDFKNKELLKHVHADAYHSIKDRLQREAVKIKKQDHTFHFIREKMRADPEKLLFSLKGAQRTYIQRSKKAASLKEEEVVYRLYFALERGRLFLKTIQKEEKKL